MFNRIPDLPKYYQRQLEQELERTLSAMHLINQESPEYTKRLRAVETLHGLLETPKPSRPSVSKEAVLAAGTNLLGILMIIKHESVNVITSKALGFVKHVR